MLITCQIVTRKDQGKKQTASWRVRQKKSKFKKQEHRTFIDWSIVIPAKITSKGHQIELKIYEHHFYEADWEELDRLVEAA